MNCALSWYFEKSIHTLSVSHTRSIYRRW